MRGLRKIVVIAILVSTICGCGPSSSPKPEANATPAPIVLTKEFDYEQYVGRVIVLQGKFVPYKAIQLHGVMLGGYTDDNRSLDGKTVHAVGTLKSFEVDNNDKLPFPVPTNGKLYYLFSLDNPSEYAKLRVGEYSANP